MGLTDSSVPLRELFFVSCARGPKEETSLFRSLKRLGIDKFHFFEHNQAGLAACYNQYIDRFVGTDQILVLAHSDISITDLLIREKLSDAARQFNVVGIIGSSHFDFNLQTLSYAWPVWPRESLTGAVEQLLEDGSTFWLSFGPIPKRCVIMDGVFIAVDMLKIGNVRFDPQFDFHLYDIDFCLTAHLLGKLSLGTANIHVQHESFGDFQCQAYRDAMKRFRSKWSPTPKTQPRLHNI